MLSLFFCESSFLKVTLEESFPLSTYHRATRDQKHCQCPIALPHGHVSMFFLPMSHSKSEYFALPLL